MALGSPAANSSTDLVPWPAPMPIGGEKVTLEEFKSALSLDDFRIPEYLPSKVGLVEIRLKPKISIADLIFSMSKVKDEATIDDVVSTGGMILIVHISPMNNDEAAINNIIEHNIKDTKYVQRITVNGAIGAGVGEGVHNGVHTHGQIQWWRDGVHYDLIADLPLEELTKIAESM